MCVRWTAFRETPARKFGELPNRPAGRGNLRDLVIAACDQTAYRRGRPVAQPGTNDSSAFPAPFTSNTDRWSADLECPVE